MNSHFLSFKGGQLLSNFVPEYVQLNTLLRAIY